MIAAVEPTSWDITPEELLAAGRLLESGIGTGPAVYVHVGGCHMAGERCRGVSRGVTLRALAASDLRADARIDAKQTLGFSYEQGARPGVALHVEEGQAGAEAVQAVEIGQGSLPVSPAAMVDINALACDLRETVDQRVRDHEISLLLSCIIGGQGKGPLGVECPALDSSAGHVQRFVSECTGLGVMAAAGEALFDWKPGASGLSSFDVLPGELPEVYAKTGVRPDRLYDLSAGRLWERRGSGDGAPRGCARRARAPREQRK